MHKKWLHHLFCNGCSRFHTTTFQPLYEHFTIMVSKRDLWKNHLLGCLSDRPATVKARIVLKLEGRSKCPLSLSVQSSPSKPSKAFTVYAKLMHIYHYWQRAGVEELRASWSFFLCLLSLINKQAVCALLQASRLKSLFIILFNSIAHCFWGRGPFILNESCFPVPHLPLSFWSWMCV